jgi:hypothetical protein
MPFKLETRKWIWVFSLMFLAGLYGIVPGAAGFADLIVQVGDTTATSGEQNSVISVYMTNWADTIAGYELWLVLNRPDIIEFQTSYDTLYDSAYWRCTTWVSEGVCDEEGWMEITDSVLMDTLGVVIPDSTSVDTTMAFVGNHDVSGTLCENWQLVRSTSIGSVGSNLKIAAQANTLIPPYTPGIGYPQLGEVPVIKLLADVFEIPDWWEDRTVEINIQADNLDNFSVSDQDGNAIGVITDTILVDYCWTCTYWTDPESTICWEYASVPCDTEGVSIDSVWCCDTAYSGHLDTSLVHIFNGELRVLTGICGDANGDEIVNIFDITRIISYLYLEGPPPVDLDMCDVNIDGLVNIFDITYIISFLYLEGPAPNCG